MSHASHVGFRALSDSQTFTYYSVHFGNNRIGADPVLTTTSMRKW
jgi:hypothetical protein